MKTKKVRVMLRKAKDSLKPYVGSLNQNDEDTDDEKDIREPGGEDFSKASTSANISDSSTNENSTEDDSDYERLLSKLENTKKRLEKKLKAQIVKRNRLRSRVKKENIFKIKRRKLLRTVFNPDQLEAMQKKDNSQIDWSDATIKKSLDLRMSCGDGGYGCLMSLNIPLPSSNVLQDKLRSLPFNSGIQEYIFELLKNKLDNPEHDYERDCALHFREIELCSYSLSDINDFKENITLLKSGEEPTHALVFMLVGAAIQWEQIVAFYFIGPTIKDSELETVLLKIIEKAEASGLKVHSITSDMGSFRRAAWTTFDITAGRFSLTMNSTTHPEDECRELCFIVNPSDLIKSLHSEMEDKKCIHFPESIQDQYDLATNTVNLKLFEQLLYTHGDHEITVMQKPEDLETRITSDPPFDVRDEAEYRTTAWFLTLISKWFSIMTYRYPNCPMTKYDAEEYEERCSILEDTITVFRALRIGENTSWTPVQTGFIISTASLLELAEYYLGKQKFEFLLTTRITQGTLGNIFMAIRTLHPQLSASELKKDLRSIIAFQIFKDFKPFDNFENEDVEDYLEVIQHE